MRERTVEQQLHLEVTLAGGTTRKFKSPGRVNVPDRIVIWPQRDTWGARVSNVARVHFIECKAPDKKARAGQVREHRRLKALGCVVLVLDTCARVDNYVRRNK